MQAVFDPANYSFSGYSVPVFLVGSAIGLLGVVTLRRERASLAGITFFAMTASIVLWLLPVGMELSSSNRAVALFWLRACHFGVCFIPATVFSFGAAVTGQARGLRWLMLVGFVLGSVLYGIDVGTTWIIHHAERYYFGYYAIFSYKASWALFAYFAVYLGATLHILRMTLRRTRSSAMRGRVQLLMIALAISYLGTVDFLADYHIPVYPFGYAFIGTFVVLGAVVISKYRLIDITPALAAEHVIAAMDEGLIIADRDGLVRVANDAAIALTQAPSTLTGTHIATVDESWRQNVLSLLADPEGACRTDVTFDASDGTTHAVEVASSKLGDHQGRWVGTVFILHDITERWRAEQALRESEERFRALVINAADLITVIDPDTTIRYVSPAVRRVLGFDPAASVGALLIEAIHPDDRAGFRAAIAGLIAGREGTLMDEARVRDSDGSWRRVEFTASDQSDNEAIRGLVLNVRDVTDRHRLEEQLRDQALHDPLTGLDNRASFHAHVEHAIRSGRREDGDLALLFVDLDNFKSVNDTLGHDAGDAIIAEAGRALRSCIREGDAVARLGGDEFAILLEGLAGADLAVDVARRIVHLLGSPVSGQFPDVVTRASVGVAVSRCRDANAGELLKRADVAMYAAKSRGKNRFELYDADMHAAMMNRLQLLTDLEGALDRGEFFLEYQPTVELRSGRVVGAEALIRWRHPVRGHVGPLEFVPLAEESGVIVNLGRWVLGEACVRARRWQRRFEVDTGFSISVNVSVRQLAEPTFVATVAEMLARTRCDPATVVLEVTESIFAQDVGPMLATLRALKALGIRLAIDDFGTGYSSLSYLHKFPFDILKIDKSFVRSADESGEDSEFQRLIVELGRSLDLVVVAEGIERGDELEHLVNLGCEMGQGFLFGAPMPAEELEAILSREAGSEAA